MNNTSEKMSFYYCIESEKHPILNNLGLCSMVEHQSLVDIVISCGNNVLHGHKLVLAINSAYFREEFERNANIEQVIITGCEFPVVKSLVELMYCGMTKIHEDNVKYLFAAAKTFGMKVLEGLGVDFPTVGDVVTVPKPQFLTKKPKYPAYPFSMNAVAPLGAMRMMNNPAVNLMYKPHKVKRKFRIEAEHQACEKEAQASRLAIATLKKEIASAPEANTFIIEESCTETTVENFIPATGDQNYIEVDYNSVMGDAFVSPEGKGSMLQLSIPSENSQDLTADKIHNILGNENNNSNVEIMYKTNDGNFVAVTDEVLQNLQKDSLQYQVVDENGRMGELQELQLAQKPPTVDIADNFVPINISQALYQQSSNKPCEMLRKNFGILNLQPACSIAMETKNSTTNTAFRDSNMCSSSDSFFCESTNFKSEIVDLVDDKAALAEALNLNRENFSPDMFFADVITENNESDEKKIVTDDKDEI